MSQKQIKKGVIDMDGDCEVKIFFDEDLDTQHCTDLSSSLMNRDHFFQLNKSNEEDKSNSVKQEPNQQQKNATIIPQHHHFQHTRKLSDPIHRFPDDQDELQDGFSEILADSKAIQRRQRYATNINVMAKSEVGFRMFTQEDDSSEIKSNSSLGSSMINNSNSLIGSGGPLQKTDKILVNLEQHKIKVYDVNDFQKGSECCVCKSKFGLFSLRIHHCRFCGLSCCQYCSAKRINTQRACELCFITVAIKTNQVQDNSYLSSFKSQVESQEKYLKLVEEQNSKLLDQYNKMQQYSENLSTNAWKKQNKTSQSTREYEEELEEQRKQLRDIQHDKAHQIANTKNLKNILESKSIHLEDKKKALYQLEQQLKRLKEDNLMKQQALEAKQNKINNLNSKRDRLLESYNIDPTTLQPVKNHSLLDSDQLLNYDHFSLKNDHPSRSYYDATRNSSVFNEESKELSYEQQQRQQIINIRNQRCFTNQTDDSDFEPKTYNVAPKKEKKKQFCINECNF